MKKSLLLLVACLACLGTYAQDDDVYFVPSSKNKTVQQEQQTPMNRSTYTPITDEEQFSESNWAKNRGNNGWDVDEYNRRGKRYRGECSDTVKDNSCYDQGYSDGFSDGYEDGSYTSRIVRFWSPRPGVYVSSPYYLDYYDLCYDPWYYGYYSPWSWSWGWSGWYGWGSWYGWRPYYSWGWGWGPSWAWYDPWWGGPGWHHHHHYWYPSNAERGPRGGYIAYGGRRGTNGSVAYGGRGSASRPSSAWGTSGRGTTQRTTLGGTTNRPSRSFGNTRTTQQSGSLNRSSSTQRKEQSTSRPSRSFGNTDSKSFNRSSSERSSTRSSGSQRSSSSFSSPSRSSFGGGMTGGGGRSFGGGGGRSGGRR